MRAVVAVLASLALTTQIVFAQAVPGGGDWQPGANAVGDNTFQGFIDQPGAGQSIPLGAPFHVSGWVVDMSADGWAGVDGIQVLQGGTVIATGNVGGNRPDVASVTGNGFWASSGFDAIVPGNALQNGGPTTLTVAAHTPGRGTWTKQVSITISGSNANAPQTGLVLRVLQPANQDSVIGNKNGMIFGVAYDTRTRPELGTGVDRVQVYLDGPRGEAGSQFIGEANLSGTNWSLAWEPTRWNKVPHHFLWVYGRSSVSGEEKLVQVEINITQN